MTRSIHDFSEVPPNTFDLAITPCRGCETDLPGNPHLIWNGGWCTDCWRNEHARREALDEAIRRVKALEPSLTGIGTKGNILAELERQREAQDE